MFTNKNMFSNKTLTYKIYTAGNYATHWNYIIGHMTDKSPKQN